MNNCKTISFPYEPSFNTGGGGGGGGGLEYWTESEYTNSGKTGTKFIPNSVNVNQDVVLQPKGNGAILAQEPDNTIIGGNNRGGLAVDWQRSRDTATQVASGGYSVIAGGEKNTASTQFTTVGGGQSNTASSPWATVGGGFGNIASADYSTVGGGIVNQVGAANSVVAGGIGNTIPTAPRSVIAGGDTNTISGAGYYQGILTGEVNTASNYYAVVIGGGYNQSSGWYSLTHGVHCQAPSFGEMTLGLYPTTYTPASAIAFDSTDRLFVLGNGTGTSARSNAFVVFKDGKVEINEAYTLPNVDGTAGQVPVTDGAGNVTWGTVGGGGLTYWTESEYTYSGATGTKFIPVSGNTNQSVVLQPKGEGGLFANEPDGTATGGDNRARNTVDWQTVRANPDQVASGIFSVIGGGAYNKANGYNSTIAGGQANVTSEQYTAILGGRNNTASGLFSTVLAGEFNTSGGKYALSNGVYTNAPSFGETVFGLYPTIYTPSSATTFAGADKLFVLGNGTGTGARSNAFVVFKDGKVEINEAYTLPNVDGTVGQVPVTDGAGGVAWGTVGGGLTYWTESEYTYSGRTGTKLIPNSVNTNQDVVLQPKGNGGILAQQPDGTATGGNNRGSNAIDLQLARSNSLQVASGIRSVAIGSNCTASGSRSVALGYGSNATGAYSVSIFGSSSGQSSAALGGINNLASMDYSVTAGGQFNTANGLYSGIFGGYSNEVNSNYSTIAGGNNSYIGTGTSSAIVGGDTNTINGTGGYSFIGGGRENSINATALHYNYIGGGYQNSIQATERAMILGGQGNQILADSTGSAIIGNNARAEAGGKYSTVMGNGARSSRYAERVFTSGQLQNIRDNGFADIVILAKTTTATPQEMFIGNVSNQRVKIQDNSTTLVKYRWVRRKLSDNTTIATHDYYVLVDKGATAASINIVAQWEDTCLTPKAGNDGSFVGGVDDIVVSADTTNGTLKFTATGQAGQDILWFVYAQIMEIIE